MDREKRARENFCAGLNCGQSVFMAFADLTGLTYEQAMKLSAPFGGGRARFLHSSSSVREAQNNFPLSSKNCPQTLDNRYYVMYSIAYKTVCAGGTPWIRN